MRNNPFQPIYNECNRQNSIAKFSNPITVPRYIDIELTNTCNFNCFFCPTGTGQQKRNKGFMTEEVFDKILKEALKDNIPIRFVRWGEPTLHPKWMHFLQQATQNKLLTHLTTNGSRLSPKIIKKLIDLPLDSIKFSFQGIDRKSYLKMRNIDYFDTLIQTIKSFYQLRKDKLRPYIHISTTITNEPAEKIEHFKKFIKNFCDSYQVGRTVLEHIDLNQVKISEFDKKRLYILKKQESVIKIHAECSQVFDVLSINWDGTVSACCRDFDKQMIVGNISTQSLHDIWSSHKLQSYRKILAHMDHDLLPLCRTCYDLNQLRIQSVQNL